jgi:hypothetical protein
MTAVLAMAGLVAACETMPTAAPPPPPRAVAPPPPPPPTPADEFAWSTRPGQNNLSVAVDYRPAANQEWSCNSLVVALMPETSYSRGRMQTLYGSADRALQPAAAVRARSAANPGPDYGQFVRTTACDVQNSFAFTNLPNGAFYIIARLRQVRPANAANEMVVMQRVELRGGQTQRLTLPQGVVAARPAAARPAPPPARPRAAPAR